MSSYNNFAVYYDKIFPRNPIITAFLEKSFKKGEVLDLACGTGEYSISLAHLGYKVTGVDISEQMISHAKEKALKENVSVNFKLDDMLNVSSENRYEGVVCIGNALVHLESEEKVIEALKRMYKSLKKSGKIVIQIINNDLILANKLPGLTTVTNEKYSFYRNYEYDGKKIHFKTRLTDGLRVYVDEALLLPLKHQALINLLDTAGFINIQTAGGFSHKSFDLEEDITYIVTAEK